MYREKGAPGTRGRGSKVRVEGMSTQASRGQLRVVSIAGPLAGLAVLYPIHLFAQQAWSSEVADLIVGVLMVLGVLAFSTGIFLVIERQDDHLAKQREELAARHATERRLRAQMETLHRAALAITSSQKTADILQHLVDLARDLIGARYGTLGLLGPQGAIDQFYTSGMDPAVSERLGFIPQGHGLLQATLTSGMTLRIPEVDKHPHACGLPPGHPNVRSLLAVPVRQGGKIVGNFYLADRVDNLPFSEEDERLLTQLAGHASTIFHQANLTEDVRVLAAIAERERLRTTLSDNVIQRVFAIRLALEGVEEDVPVDTRPDIAHAVDQLGLVMEEIRLAIVGQGAADTLTSDDAGGNECRPSE